MRSYVEANKVLGERQSRKLENNTYLQRRTENSIAVRLHNTDVVTYYSDGSVMLNSGGYRTVTTKDRINNYSPQWVTQERGVWYVGREEAKRVFEDGVTINTDGSITGGREVVPKEDQKVIRQAAKYAKDFVQAMEDGKVEKPGSKDCWYCYLRDTDSKRPMGEVTDNRDHIKAHIEERYYVPSLLVRAIEVFPVSQVAWWWVNAYWDENATEEQREQCKSGHFSGIGKDQVRRSIYRYVKRQLGYAS